MESDEDLKFPPPPIQKESPHNVDKIDLIPIEKISTGKESFIDLVKQRRSRRKYLDDALTLEELSFLLWAVQGIQRQSKKKPITYRSVPASGGIHPFETYLVINRVNDISQGLHRYLPLDHQLFFLKPTNEAWLEQFVFACRGQSFIGKAAAVFIWTAIPYRTEWRYANEAHKSIAKASGHVCQNLYLACEAIGAGMCAVTAYAQNEMDTLLGIDGEDEFTIYLASLGKIGF
jgi:SagB-type dehydrogenase family enzyme